MEGTWRSIFLPTIKNFGTRLKRKTKGLFHSSFIQKGPAHVSRPPKKTDSDFWIALSFLKKAAHLIKSLCRGVALCVCVVLSFVLYCVLVCVVLQTCLGILCAC